MINTKETAPIKPFVTEEGIELYATDTECGMSQAGLARFCGIGENSLRDLLENINRGKVTAKSLECLVGKDIAIAVTLLKGGKDANVINSKACAAICTYYATESKAANDTARYSLGKFAAMGIDSWIRSATGHKESNSLTPEQLTIQLLLDNKTMTEKALELESKLRITTEKLLEKEQYITRAVVNAPGLQYILDNAPNTEEEDLKLLPKSEVSSLFTLAEYIEHYKYPIPDKMYRQFRLKVAGFFETLRHYTPKKELRQTKAGNPVMAYVYDKVDLMFLDAVFMQVSAAYSPKD